MNETHKNWSQARPMSDPVYLVDVDMANGHFKDLFHIPAVSSLASLASTGILPTVETISKLNVAIAARRAEFELFERQRRLAIDAAKAWAWFHDLRHTFGTIAASVSPLPEVQRAMGHSAVAVTMKYIQLGAGATRGPLSTLSKWREGGMY